MARGEVKTTLTKKLETALSPVHLSVIDDSARHEGHSGARPGGETHFRIEIVSAAFEGLSRLERQRLVYRILEKELSGPIHALSVIARTPGEFLGQH